MTFRSDLLRLLFVLLLLIAVAAALGVILSPLFVANRYLPRHVDITYV